MGNWATDILGGLQMQLAHSHARSLTLYLHKSSPSVSASFFFFLQQQKLPFNPCYGHSWLSKCDFIPASWKENAEESGSTTRPSKHSEYSGPTARAVGPQVEPTHSFWGRQFREKGKKTQLQMPHRKEEKNAGGGGVPGGWIKMVQDCLSVHIRTHLCWLQRNPLWAEAEGGEKSHPSSCEKPRKATKCIPVGGVRRDRPHVAHFRTPAGMGGFDGRWFLNVSDWWNSLSRPPLEPFSIGRQGRIVESRSSPRWIQDEQMDGGTERGTTGGNRKAGEPMIKAG